GIFMGGMFTLLKIREGLRSYDEDPGWYEQPEGTVAQPVGERQGAAPARPRQPTIEKTFDAVRHGHH
ncbi:MAG TPA: copper oxidase, partial [Thermoanaerobaculia bacterium]|nr:copper oxidase [Thermoanaerobaculia bacterium]